LQGIVNIIILIYGSTLVWGKVGKKCLKEDDFEDHFMYYFAFVLLVLGYLSLLCVPCSIIYDCFEMKKKKEYDWEKGVRPTKKDQHLQPLPSIGIQNNTPKLENFVTTEQPMTGDVHSVIGVVPSAPILEVPSYQYSTFNPMCLDYNVDPKSVCKVCHIKNH
jgi:hypothetical protein